MSRLYYILHTVRPQAPTVLAILEILTRLARHSRNMAQQVTYCHIGLHFGYLVLYLERIVIIKCPLITCIHLSKLNEHCNFDTNKIKQVVLIILRIKKTKTK